MALLLTAGEQAGKVQQDKVALKVLIAVRLLLIAIMSLAVIYARLELEDLVVEVLVMGEWFVNRRLGLM
jgi:hypothetical protein